MEQRETGIETGGFHATYPFGSGINVVAELNGANDSRADNTTAAMFSEIMSDHVPSQEQIGPLQPANLTHHEPLQTAPIGWR